MVKFLAALGLTALCHAQDVNPLARSLTFEADPAGKTITGWGAPSGSAFLDSEIVHGGKYSARIERRTGAAGEFTGIIKSIPIDFAGSAVEIRGFLRSEEVTGFVAMWMRIDGEAGSIGFDTTQKLQVNGTTAWKEYSIHLPLSRNGKELFFGVLVSGTGKVWTDDLQILVDGKPVWEAPKAERPKTIVDTDHEFDAGSKISLTTLTSIQIDNLTTLGKVWGFLKYHHPKIVSGQRHWDYELFRIMPEILAASDRAAANTALLEWATGLGEIADCQPCARLEGDLQLRPALSWIDDQALLGAKLSAALRRIHTNRPASGKQFYLSQVRGVGNPVFEHELAYQSIRARDAGFQILALYRFWNIIEYWFPNREIIGENWDGVLKDSLPKIALAKDRDSYQLEMMALIARIHDTHANLWSSIAVRPPVGACLLPINVRFIDNNAVVASYSAAEEGEATGIRPGDIITALDGVAVSKLVESWTPYYAASNGPTRLRDIARNMTRGACGEARIHVRRADEELDLKPVRAPAAGVTRGQTHDTPGDTFRRLSQDVAYIKLSSIKIADVPGYVDSAAGTKGLIIDIRNYPSEFVVFTLGQLLVNRPTEFVRFTVGDLNNPGAFHWNPPLALTPKEPHYSGKVVILVDEVSQSQAEYTAMAFRVAPGAKVIGSTTAGADGNVSQIPLPGGLSSMISGIGVFYPDKRPTQRVGILSDIDVEPTIAGIRAGKDELLDAAIAEILK